MVYSWPEHSQPQKPFPGLLCRFWQLLCTSMWRKCCCSDAIAPWTLQIFPELQEPFPLYSSPVFLLAQTVGNMLAPLLFCRLGDFFFCCCCLFCFVVLLWNIDYFSSILFDCLFIREMYHVSLPTQTLLQFQCGFNNKGVLNWSRWVTLWSSPLPPPISQAVWGQKTFLPYCAVSFDSAISLDFLFIFHGADFQE